GRVPAVRALPPRVQRHHAERGVERVAGAEDRHRDRVLRLAQPHPPLDARAWRRDRVPGAGRARPPLRPHRPPAPATPPPAFNARSAHWPQVGFAPDGTETYGAFLRFDDAHIDPPADAGLTGVITGVGFGDVFMSLSLNGGAFTPPQNLTNTPNTDERFFS